MFQGNPRRMNEFWIIYHLYGNTLSVWYWGERCAVHLRSCYRVSVFGDWWWGIFHCASISSRIPLLWWAEMPHYQKNALTNCSSQCLPSWWINVYCVSVTAPSTLPSLCCEMRDEYIQIWSRVACTSSIIIFHRWIPPQAGWCSGHLGSETITHKHGACSLSPQRNLGPPASFQPLRTWNMSNGILTNVPLSPLLSINARNVCLCVTRVTLEPLIPCIWNMVGFTLLVRECAVSSFVSVGWEETNVSVRNEHRGFALLNWALYQP